jgi:hypothetical protein
LKSAARRSRGCATSITALEAAAMRTSRNYVRGQPAPEGVAADVLVVLWCRSVGMSWTLELHQLDADMAPGIIEDWITSGVPISQPAPDALARELLADRGLRLFLDSSVGPCTRNRHGIGYVSRNAELIRLAYLVLDDAAEIGTHPVMLAAQWIMAGFSPNAATRWIREGVHFPPMG